MNTINFLIITACALSLFAVFYIDRKTSSGKAGRGSIPNTEDV